MSVTEIFIAYGFTYRGRCTCMGPKTDKYKKKDYTIYWNKRAKQIRIKHYGKAITVALPENELEDAIKKYVPQETAQSLN